MFTFGRLGLGLVSLLLGLTAAAGILISVLHVFLSKPSRGAKRPVGWIQFKYVQRIVETNFPRPGCTP